ncbi:MAG: hypothetical protein M3Q23_13165 [Actinomycetota bacterium]|nr:hypothetical protein [Actinomycetota bacterium]
MNWSTLASAEDEEAGAYVEWLRQRTINLTSRPDFWPAVEAIAGALVKETTASGPRARKVIEGALEEWRTGLRERGWRA